MASFLGFVPAHCRKVPPVLAVVAEDRDRVGVHRAGARLVVVLADQVGQGQREVKAGHSFHPKVVPVRLAISPSFIKLALHGTPESTSAQRLDLAQRSPLEVGVEEDLGIPPGRFRTRPEASHGVARDANFLGTCLISGWSSTQGLEGLRVDRGSILVADPRLPPFFEV